MMTTYFPSLLLIAITFATTFFKPFFFEAALSVNLTTMLVMTTITQDITQEPLATKDGSKIKVEDGTNPKEAWTFSEIKLLKAGSLTMLTMTGNILISFLISYRTALSEKKVLPLTVLIASIVYFAIAASFYFE